MVSQQSVSRRFEAFRTVRLCWLVDFPIPPTFFAVV